MKLDPGQLDAALRHVYTGVGVLTSTLVVVGLAQGDASTIGVAVHKIGDGVASIVGGISMLVPLVSGAYAAISASRKSRMVAMNVDPQMQVLAAKPGTDAAAIADTIPGNKVIVATPAVVLAAGNAPSTVTNIKGAA